MNGLLYNLLSVFYHSSTVIREYSLTDRTGTGSYISGLGRARTLSFGLGSGSGFPCLGFKPVGLWKFYFKPLVEADSKAKLTVILVIEPSRA